MFSHICHTSRRSRLLSAGPYGFAVLLLAASAAAGLAETATRCSQRPNCLTAVEDWRQAEAAEGEALIAVSTERARVHADFVGDPNRITARSNLSALIDAAKGAVDDHTETALSKYVDAERTAARRLAEFEAARLAEANARTTTSTTARKTAESSYLAAAKDAINANAAWLASTASHASLIGQREKRLSELRAHADALAKAKDDVGSFAEALKKAETGDPAYKRAQDYYVLKKRQAEDRKRSAINEGAIAADFEVPAARQPAPGTDSASAPKGTPGEVSIIAAFYGQETHVLRALAAVPFAAPPKASDPAPKKTTETPNHTGDGSPKFRIMRIEDVKAARSADAKQPATQKKEETKKPVLPTHLSCAATTWMRATCEFEAKKLCRSKDLLKDTPRDIICDKEETEIRSEPLATKKKRTLCEPRFTYTTPCGGDNPAPSSERVLAVRFSCPKQTSADNMDLSAAREVCVHDSSTTTKLMSLYLDCGIAPLDPLPADTKKPKCSDFRQPRLVRKP